MEKIAKRVGSIVDVMSQLNRSANMLHEGDVLKFQKAKVQKVITGWRTINTAAIKRYYNGKGDSRYLSKLEFALRLVRATQGAKCEQ